MNKNLISLFSPLLHLSWLLATDITVTMYEESQYASGYTIFGTLEGKYSAIIDKDGNEIWNSGNQDIVYYNFSQEGIFFGCRFLNEEVYENYLNSAEFSLSDGIIWQEPNNEFAHHEILKLPWGNYLGIVSKDTIAPIPEGNWGGLVFFQMQGAEFPWRYDKLVEWDKNTKEVVWSWATIDHYSMEDYDSTLWNMTTLNEGILEWTHINAIFYDAEDSSIYISSRHLSRISKIDYPSGDIIWNMGQNMPSGDVTFGHDLRFSWQHSLDLKDGNIILLDNGNKTKDFNHLPGEERITRAMEISINEYSAVPEASIFWEYNLPNEYDGTGEFEEYFGLASGNVQKLNNGNYLITTMGKNGTTFEVTSGKEIVWKANYGTPLIYRANRIPISMVCNQIDCTDLSIDSNIKPGIFKLNNIYPNPFNPIINIDYEISKFSFISAKILNLKGQIIDIIDLEYKKPGNYSITWDGSLQPSGIYLFVLDNQTSKLTQKIMLVK